MMTRGGHDLFERLTVLHRPDCTALPQPWSQPWLQPGPAPASPPDEGEVARLFASDAAGRYGVEARAVYEDLRRLIGQLAGLLILARLTSRRETGDLPEIASCRDRHASAETALAGLSAPGPLAAHLALLREATARCAAILSGLLRWRPDSPTADADFAALNASIRRAYLCLERCSSERAQLRMVDFSHACCTCGGH